MKFLNDMKVGSKIMLLVAALLVCITVVAGVGIMELRNLDEESDIMYERNMVGLSAAKEANIKLLSMERALRNIILVSPELRDTYLKQYAIYITQVREQLAVVEQVLLTQKAKETLDRTLLAFERLLPANQEIIDNLQYRTSAETVARLTEVRPLANATDDMMTELADLIDNATRERNERINAQADQAFIISIVVLVLALLIGFILGTVIRKNISDPLVRIAGKATKVAQGNLDQDFTLHRKDETGILAEALAQMVENLRTRIAESEQKSREAEDQSRRAQAAMAEAEVQREKSEQSRRDILAAAENVEQVVNRLSASTEELSAQVEQSSRSTEMQRERVSASATAMDEMNSTVLEVARNAGIAADGSDKAKENALMGQNIVQDSVDSINKVQEDTLEMQKNMEELGRQTEAIGAIMTVISDIADQTNLLALNAAIEAARAGEAGRGFAVVADEVRKLAEKTMNATKEVGSAITGIQNGARMSINAVERTTGNLTSTTELVQRSGEALVQIVHEVTAAAAQVTSIATASEEQSAASEEITRALDEINRMADETALAMQQSAQAVSELSVQTQQLQTLVNDLRHG